MNRAREGSRARYTHIELGFPEKKRDPHFKSDSHHRARIAQISSSSIISSCSITELGYDSFFPSSVLGIAFIVLALGQSSSVLVPSSVYY